MKIILGQIIFILVLIFFLIYIFRLRSDFLDRFLYVLVTVIGIIFIILPDTTTFIANQIGIGRGADLLLYLFIFLFLFYAVSSSIRYRRMERKMTQVVRFLAIHNSHKPNDEGEK